MRAADSDSLDIRLRYALSAVGTVVVAGTIGYMLIERWSFLDSMYMTVIALTTVGFGEVRDLTDYGKIFTMVLVICGMGTMAYSALTATQLLVDRQVRKVLGRRRMDRSLRDIEDHIIVCGHGRVGSQICLELKSRGVPYVTIDKDPDQAEIPEDALFVRGDATEEEALQEARVEHAKGLISALPEDADNAYVTITARQLNPKLFITMRADSDKMEAKLRRAGADRVVCPHRAGARRMAVSTLLPNVVDFMDIVVGDDANALRLEEVRVGPGSKFIGQTLRDIAMRQRYEVSVIGIKRSTGKQLLHPGSGEAIQEGDMLLLVGAPVKLEGLIADACRTE
jgi:voltage-gated potassium channel